LKAAKIMNFIEVVAAVISKGRMVLLSRRDEGAQAGLWEFPGGKLKPGETWALAIEREIFEELGIQIRVKKRLLVIEHDYPEKRVRLHFIHCALPPEGEKKIVCGKGVEEIQWIDPFASTSLQLCPPDRLALSRLPWNEILEAE